MTQIYNIIKNEKNDKIIYTLEDIGRNENETMTIYEANKIIKRLPPKEKLIIRTKEGLTSNEKSTQKSYQNTSKIFLIQTQHQCRTYYQHRCQHYSHHQE